ncbi:peptide-binding protein [Thermosulfuriphilus ammonigenes]|uniref:Peptide-binding protein n=1 Tax=Thermosulfuriphilus ammonigenes TaxID=1936021 RepID=A0A6G7PZ47_9BACT|nr:peptide-binding protein [Thermosulfuriphilus ammonigenes]MBA2849030.1 peptide/nickel transport system substrate-binding protein [Thermosulfuriphilus ammonigenes]QIJ72718.1 peptide-binding protein [Thermosulfuriphilus ammonigenes]HFB84122.1 peptide-binding protein [Thermodesulfatator sp.]
MILLLSLLLILFSFVPAKGEKACPATGDAIIVGSIGDASILIPMLATDATSHTIAGLIFNGLVKYDRNLNLVGDLAQGWKVENGGRTITFYLRRGVLWEDGVEFTAEDVLFGFRLITDKNTPTAYAGDFLEVEKAEAVDRYTFRVHYREPFAPALSSWGNIVILPKHILEGQDITKTDFGRHPVGLGPYRLKEWLPQQRIVLEANSHYFEGRPCLDYYIQRVIPDPATMFLELRAGKLDWMGLTPIQYQRQTNDPAFKRQFHKYKYLSFSYTYLGYNLRHPFFKDKRIRQAISYAINKQEIIEGVLLGLGVVATGPYKPDAWYYNPNVRRYPYNPQRARELLAQAGWRDTDGDGILDKDGQPFEFTVITNQGNSLRLRTAQIIQYRLAQIGIKMHIRTIEWTSFIKEFIDKRRFEAVILGWTLGQDPDIYDIWHSSKVEPPGLNFIGYINPEVDKLLVAGRRTFDKKRRREIYARIQEILAEDQPYTFLYVPMALPVIHRRFRGIEPAPAGISYNFIRWWVPKNEQKYLQP